MKITRRSLVMLPVLAPLAALGRETSEEYRFHHDFILGTSLDLTLWMEPSLTAGARAERAAHVAVEEIRRLSNILSTYDGASEIRQVEDAGARIQSADLSAVVAQYQYWQDQTHGVLSIRPRGAASRMNVDALGKAYIIDRVAERVRTSGSSVNGLLLNIGGDMMAWGQPRELSVADPGASHDNGIPFTRILVKNEAVATSGTYARGAHLIDARTGTVAHSAACATVLARDAVTANALATALCILDVDAGMHLVERTAGAEGVRIGPDGRTHRSTGFADREVFQPARQSVPTNWPAGYEVAISLTLTTPDPRLDRSYVAMWVEDMSGKLVRAIVLWGNKADYHEEMTDYWKITRADKAILYRTTRATRAPGSYRVVWNGMDEQNKPVARGRYRISIETNRYHGDYAKAVGVLTCGDEPASIVLPDRSTNFESIALEYGPRRPPA